MTSHDLSTHGNGVLDLMEEHTVPEAIFFPHNPSSPRRRAGALTLIALLAIVLCWSTTADAQELLLAADFDDKPLNQPIDTGGAALGEPVNVSTVLDAVVRDDKSEEHTSELQSRGHLVCRLLLEKKKR